MTTKVSWPSTTDRPYEVTVATANSDLELEQDESEFERFEGLTRDLLAVSKDELNTKRREEAS